MKFYIVRIVDGVSFLQSIAYKLVSDNVTLVNNDVSKLKLATGYKSLLDAIGVCDALKLNDGNKYEIISIK